MGDAKIPIGQVKRDISELVNRVAYGGERVILTSRDKPKAALVSMDDYERLRKMETTARQLHMTEWLAKADALGQSIRMRRGGEAVGVDELLCEDRQEREERDERRASGH